LYKFNLNKKLSLRDAIARLIEDSEANSEAEKILKSIEINALKANKIRKAQLQLKVGYFSANIQPPITGFLLSNNRLKH
jgi:hypothetical protein